MAKSSCPFVGNTVNAKCTKLENESLCLNILHQFSPNAIKFCFFVALIEKYLKALLLVSVLRVMGIITGQLLKC